MTGPDGIRRRKYVKGRTYEETKEAWLALHTRARSGPIASAVPTVAQHITYWLAEVVEPNLAPKTYEKYEMFSRLYVIPGLGTKRLDRLQARDIRAWLNQLRTTCQCCAQGKDATRPRSEQRCCALGRCSCRGASIGRGGARVAGTRNFCLSCSRAPCVVQALSTA